jgi:TOMM system kinase/cyclase fusion protein
MAEIREEPGSPAPKTGEGEAEAGSAPATRPSADAAYLPTLAAQEPAGPEPALALRLARSAPRTRDGQVVPEAGERLGGDGGQRFAIEKRLGEGSMGVVFRARDALLERTIAIKFLLRHAGLSPDALLEMLRLEARAAARLDHENIVRVFDLGTWRGVPFLVMEYLEGESLQAALARRRLDDRRATRILIGVASALAHAHEQGIVHRDLKPSNVFLLGDGRVKILDFGLARPVVTGTPERRISGTPQYMAPEQWRGESQDGRTDIWAAGVIFFELLAGSRPVAADDDLERVRLQVTSDDPVAALSAHRTDLPEVVEEIVARALRKQPDARFQSAVELRDALIAADAVLARGVRPEAGGDRPLRLARAERRQLTLLAARLQGVPALDLDELSEVLGAFQRITTDAIHQHHGTIIGCVGARVLACFGYPIASENDAQRAVRAGLRVVAGTEQLASRCAHDRLTAQVGIQTGLVVVDQAEGRGAPGVPAIQGALPAVAEVLAEQAPPGSVLIGRATSAVTAGLIEVMPHGAVALAGLPQPLDTFLVTGERRVASRFERAFAQGLTPLCGRELELAALRERWQKAASGRGQLVVISGEAGIGKSRLAQALIAEVADAPATPLVAQCWPQFRSSPFYPLIELLERSSRIQPDDSPETRIEKLTRTVTALGLSPAELLPLLARLMALPLDEAAAEPPPRPDVFRAQALQALVDMLFRMAAQQPLLLLVEDVHWADHSTLEGLSRLVERAQAARLLVVVTTRPEFRAPFSTSPALFELHLDRLARPSALALVEHVGQGRGLPAELVAEVVARADGVPLFLEELARMVADALAPGQPANGATLPQPRTPTPVSIPNTLSELLLGRLDRLTGPTREVAQIAAIIGRSFTDRLIHQVAGTDEATIEHALAQLTDAGLLVPQGSPALGRYSFRHALLQEAAYQSVLRSVRQQYHQRIARILQSEMPELVAAQPELLAHHFAEAGQVEQAIEHFERAGQRATQQSAQVDAIGHFQRALGLLATLPATPERDQRELNLTLALGAPLMAVRGYASSEVEATYERARQLCGSSGQTSQLFSALAGLWQYQMVAGRVHQSLELGERLLRLARGLAQSTPLLLAHRALATSLLLDGQLTACRDHTARGLALYDLAEHRTLAFRHGHDPGVAHGGYAAWSLWLLGHPDQALKRALNAVALARELRHPMTFAFAMDFLAMIHNYRGEHGAAREMAEAANVIASEHRFALWLAWGTLQRGWALGGLGRVAEALIDLRAGLAGWMRTGARAGLTYFPTTLAAVCLRAGHHDECARVLDEAATLAASNREVFYEAELHRLRGELALARGGQEAWAEAEARFRRALEVARNQGARAWELRAAESLARLCKERSRREEGRRLLAPVYQWFTEGLGTADLESARALLSELADA